MRFDATSTYPAPPVDVAAMLADPEYVRRRVAASGAVRVSQEVTGDAMGTFTVSTTRTMPAEMIPQRYRGFVSGGLTMTFVEEWSPPSTDHSRTGRLALTIAGAPASASGTCALRPSAKGSRVTYEGDLRVRLPLVGPSIERAAVQAVQQGLDVERGVGLDWLAGR